MESIYYRPVTDRRTLNAIAKKYGLRFHDVYHYCIDDSSCYVGPFSRVFKIAGKEYKLKYYDGCFYPYIVRT